MRSSGKLLNNFCLIRLQLFRKHHSLQKGEIISGESKAANSFSNFFENTMRSLGIKEIWAGPKYKYY